MSPPSIGIDAAVVLPNGRLYVFTLDRVWRWDLPELRPCAGYPRPIRTDLPGCFARNIDAAVVDADGRLSLFRGNEHMRYDLARLRPLPGYPRPLAADWPGAIPDRVDAAVRWAPDIVYLFAGNTYTSFSPGRGRPRPGFPKQIAGNWPGISGGPVRAALVLPDDSRVLVTDAGIRVYDAEGRERPDGSPVSRLLASLDRGDLPEAAVEEESEWEALERPGEQADEQAPTSSDDEYAELDREAVFEDANPPAVATSAGAWMDRLRVSMAVAQGERDENTLTNTIFFSRHPELGGRRIRPDETALAHEWIQIRDQIVRPVLQLTGSRTSPGPPSAKSASSRGASPGTVVDGLRSTAWLRRAWERYRCEDKQMTGVPILGYRRQVNPLTVGAFAALDRALRATGYRASRVGTYNCRSIVNAQGQPAGWSLHAYGLAVDIDPSCNPHRRNTTSPVRFSSKPTPAERCEDVRRDIADTTFTQEQVAAAESIRTIGGLPVFAWGGRWRTSHDSMHFQVNVSPDELAGGLAADSFRQEERLDEMADADEAFLDLLGRAQEPAFQAESAGEMAGLGFVQGTAPHDEYEGEHELEYEDEDEETTAGTTGAMTWKDRLRVSMAVARGDRDENTLTNMVFSSRHPELGGRSIRREETALAREWVEIRDQVVRPVVRAVLAGTASRAAAAASARGAAATISTPAPGATPPPILAPGGLPSESLGTLVLDAPGMPSFSYPFTPEDALWTAKLVVLEAGGTDDADNAAVIWAMLNRYALFTRTVFPTFTRFIRAYSTPLQPVLRNPNAARRHLNGDFVRTGGFYPGTDIPRGQLRRHLDMQAKPWNAIRQSARSLTLRTQRGAVRNPGIGLASEFASTRVFWRSANQTTREPTRDEWQRYTEEYARRRKGRPIRWIGNVDGIEQMKNAFFLDRRAEGRPANAVRVLPP